MKFEDATGGIMKPSYPLVCEKYSSIGISHKVIRTFEPLAVIPRGDCCELSCIGVKRHYTILEISNDKILRSLCSMSCHLAIRHTPPSVSMTRRRLSRICDRMECR